MKFLSSFPLLGLLLGWVLVVFSIPSGWAQEVSSPEAFSKLHLLKTAPVHLEEVNLSYERLRRPNRSVQFGLGYLYQAHVNAGSAGEPVARRVNGFALRVSRRTYSGRQRTGPEGGYRGPMAMYRYMAFPPSSRNEHLIQQVAALQYMWGKQRIFANWLVVDGYVGLGGRNKYAYERNGDSREDMYRNGLFGILAASGPTHVILLGPSVHLNLSVGVAF